MHSSGIRGNKDITDIPKAMFYFKKAIQLGNPELRAEATFMLAKCERDLHRKEDYRRNYADKTDAPKPENYLKTYQKIQRDFADTKYYKSVISECKDYQAHILK